MKLEAGVDETLCLVLKIDAFTATSGLERRMSSLLSRAWKATAREALVRPLDRLLSGGRFTLSRIAEFVESLGAKLRQPLTPA